MTVRGLNVQKKPNGIFLSCLLLKWLFSRFAIGLNYNINSMHFFYDA